MRIIFAIAHYYKYLEENALYASLRSNAQIKIDALSNCILNLHHNFGSHQGIVSWKDQAIFPANQQESHIIDIVVCTTNGSHLLDRLMISEDSYEHHPTLSAPLLLGFECQRILFERLGEYDYYCYLEDDIIIQDPLFFHKLEWFNFCAGDSCVLQPHRYEVSALQTPLKVYIDGDISALATQSFQNREEIPTIDGDLLTIPTVFNRPYNPHAGCFFLNARQMQFWVEQEYFLDKDTGFVGPLESAATLGVMKTFRVYKTIPQQAALFEVMHWGSHYLKMATG